MAEMAAEQAVTMLKESTVAGEYGPVLAALIQQQAQTISELQTEIAYQNKQIARLQEDLSREIGGKQ